GIVNKNAHVFTEDGEELDLPTNSFQDTLGASPFDMQKRYGLGHDTGIKLAFVDEWDERATNQRLTNGFRYFYTVTAYDWNMGESLESSIVFTEKNMVIPRSDANTYRVAGIEMTRMYDGAGNVIESSGASSLSVVEGQAQGSATPTDAFANEDIIINNAELITGETEYRIRIDSIVGGPGVMFNHQKDPLFDPNIWQTVYVSLFDLNGRVLRTDFSQMKADVDEFQLNADLSKAHFILSPEPDSGRGVPFSVEFDIQPFDFNYMYINTPVVLQGLTDPSEIKIKQQYNKGNNNLPAGFRAADFEIEFVDAGNDSLTLMVTDLTHNVDVPFMSYPGSGWCITSSWSRFLRLMKDRFRDELTYDDVFGGGPKLNRMIQKFNASDFPLSRAARIRIYLCGIQLSVSTKSPPVLGDKWLIRTSFGTMPEEDGALIETGPRPPVAGVSYGVKILPDQDENDNLNMKRIRVVPNPFIVTTPWDQSPLSKQIQFVNLPGRCKIRIYTLGGHLVQVLDHDGCANAYSRQWKGGSLNWNLMNRFNTHIASGWYIWHATDLDTGKKKMGKFAVIQ
ncbi:MAG: hypothetical protein U9P14_06770, partial [Gemmatimonadota bacterium]|nr:hypothetical protein [Gemmatimonadota bacterium]